MTLTAQWKANTYTVTVENDGNGTASADPASAKMGAEVSLTAMPKSGYHFKRWEVVPDKVEIENNKFTMPADDVTVKAIFERNASSGGSGGGGGGTTYYTLTFETNGGGSMQAIRAARGKTLDLSAYTPMRDGYDFGGWYADKDLTQRITEIKLISASVINLFSMSHKVPVIRNLICFRAFDSHNFKFQPYSRDHSFRTDIIHHFF